MQRTPKIVEFENCSFHTGLVGEGPPVLFIQGVGIHGEGWRPQVEVLARHHRCLIFDNRGMGRSQGETSPLSIEQMAKDALAILSAHEIDRAHIVGHSMGGTIAMALALAEPKRVLSLSLLCTMAKGAAAAPLSWRMITLGLGTVIGTRAMRRRAFVRLILPPGNWTHAVLDQLAQAYEPCFGHDLGEQPPIAHLQLKALRKYDATAKLKELGAFPTLVVSATHDPIAPPALGKVIASGIPGARFVELENASHGVPIAEPARINDLLLGHLASAPS